MGSFIIFILHPTVKVIKSRRMGSLGHEQIERENRFLAGKPEDKRHWEI
jgi:hypothetical protein